MHALVLTFQLLERVTDESVDGENDGEIDITVSGGTMPYEYAWDNDAETEDISSLMPGEYTVTVTDSNGCVGNKSFTVEAGPGLCDTVEISITGEVTDESVLGESDGAIDVTVSGDYPSFDYDWGDALPSTQDLADLAPGMYTVIVTDSIGCSEEATFTVDPGVDPCASSDLQVTVDVTDESGAGSGDGSIDATVTGGISPYTYAWSNDEETEDISGLSANSYTIIVTDSVGCTATATGTVGQGPVAVIDLQGLKLFSIYPNPASTEISLEVKFIEEQSFEIEIIDLTGRSFYQSSELNTNELHFEIEITWPEGLYFIQIASKNGTIAMPFIVME